MTTKARGAKPAPAKSVASPKTEWSGPNVRWAAPVTFPLALIGLGISIYLTIQHFNHSKHFAGCAARGKVDCAKVTTSSQSEIFGHIPVALAGLLYYIAMVVLVSPWAWRMANEWVGRIRLAAAVAGIGMVVYLVYVEAVQLKSICIYCTGVHIVTFFLFLAILAAYLLRPLDPFRDR